MVQKHVFQSPFSEMSTDPDEFFHTSVDVWSSLVGSTYPDRYFSTD